MTESNLMRTSLFFHNQFFSPVSDRLALQNRIFAVRVAPVVRVNFTRLSAIWCIMFCLRFDSARVLRLDEPTRELDVRKLSQHVTRGRRNRKLFPTTRVPRHSYLGEVTYHSPMHWRRIDG